MEMTKVVKPFIRRGMTQYFWQYIVYNLKIDIDHALLCMMLRIWGHKPSSTDIFFDENNPSNGTDQQKSDGHNDYRSGIEWMLFCLKNARWETILLHFF